MIPTYYMFTDTDFDANHCVIKKEGTVVSMLWRKGYTHNEFPSVMNMDNFEGWKTDKGITYKITRKKKEADDFIFLICL